MKNVSTITFDWSEITDTYRLALQSLWWKIKTSNFSKAHVTRDSSDPAILAISVQQ